MPQITNRMIFEAGIEQISMRGEQAPASLPGAAPFVPGDSPYTKQLTELLFPPSIEQSLMESFRPDIEHREIQGPVDYHNAMVSCHGELAQMLEKNPDHPRAEHLQRAVDELQQEMENHQTVSISRHLLHQA